MTRNCCFISRLSATTAFAPPGPMSLAMVANRCIRRTRKSFMGRSGREQLRQKQDSSSNCFHVTINNSPCTRLANHPHGGYLHIQNRSGAVDTYPSPLPTRLSVPEKQWKGIARIGKGHRLHQLGTVLPEIHPGSPSGYLHHSGNLENTSHD